MSPQFLFENNLFAGCWSLFHLDVSRSALSDPVSLEPSRSAKVTLDDFLESALKIFVEVRVNDGVQ